MGSHLSSDGCRSTTQSVLCPWHVIFHLSFPENRSVEENSVQIAEALLYWQRAHLRTLPWRNAPAGQRSPYAVWVSEIMAQQTRLATAETYFMRWMARFPTIHALADAELQEVLKLWEGLGYYARARNLHKAARMVVQEHGGVLPCTRTELLSLPGIGDYTAGAILSLAYGQPEPILDGNVKRVLSRLYDIETSIDDSSTVKRLWRLSEDLVRAAGTNAGAFNEALMELGALVCNPRAPHCDLCPVLQYCFAYASDTVDSRPVRRERMRTPYYDVTAAVVWQGEPHDSQLLIAQRPLDGMLGGLWEFPGGKVEPSDASFAACLQREIQEELAIEIDVLEPITQVQHAYTHFRITLHAFHAQLIHGTPQAVECADWRWIDWCDLNEYPFPVTDQKVIQALGRERNAASTS